MAWKEDMEKKSRKDLVGLQVDKQDGAWNVVRDN